MVTVYSGNKSLDVIAVDDWWSIPSIFSQKTIEQVIKEAVLSEVSKLNWVVMNKK